MNLNELSNDNFASKQRKRVGRGIGSGKGKTSGRGHKGQKSRAGATINGFEGGQMPIYRRLPKRGFVNPFRVAYQSINVGDIQGFIDRKRIDPKKTITKASLYEAGILKKLSLPLKILGNGELKASVKVEAESASKGAISLIEKAGGSFKELPVSSTKKDKKVEGDKVA